MTGTSRFDLRPRRIAVIGASERNFYTSWALRNLAAFDFDGEVYPVHPSATEVLGLRCYPSVAELPEDPELGIVGIRASACLEAARQLAARGCRTVVVLSDGFRESATPEGERLERELVDWARDASVTLIGPNGVGVGDRPGRVMPIAEPVPLDLKAGPVSIVSQSGGMLSTIMAGLAWERAGVDLCISVGNGAAFDVLDAIDAATQRDTTEVIVAYLEGLGREPGKLDAVLERVRTSGKRLVAIKPGTSATARRLVESHTASLTGPDATVRAVLADRGVALVDCIEDLVRAGRLARLFAVGAPVRIAVLGSSGGAASVTSDLAETNHVALSGFSAATQDALAALVPESGFVGNPIDLSGRSGGDEVDSDRIYGQIAADETVDALVVPFSATLPDETPPRTAHRTYLESLAEISERHGKPLIISSVAAQRGNAWLTDFEKRHPTTAVVEGLRTTLAAIGALSPPPGLVPSRAPADASDARDGAPLPNAGAVLSEAEGRERLEAAGFAIVPGRAFVADAILLDLITAGTAGLAFPLVVKAILPGVTHKAAIGGVVVGCANESEVVDAVGSLQRASRESGAVMTGVLLEEMVSGTELLVGLTRDPLYGPALTVGLGGALAEVGTMHGTAVLPFADRDAVHALLVRADLAGLIERSAAGAQFVDQLFALGAAFVDGPLADLATVEINPVFLTGDGRALAADVLAITADHVQPAELPAKLEATP